MDTPSIFDTPSPIMDTHSWFADHSQFIDTGRSIARLAIVGCDDGQRARKFGLTHSSTTVGGSGLLSLALLADSRRFILFAITDQIKGVHNMRVSPPLGTRQLLRLPAVGTSC